MQRFVNSKPEASHFCAVPRPSRGGQIVARLLTIEGAIVGLS